MAYLLTGARQYWLPLTLLIWVAITALSLWPVDELPAVPGTDKTHHFIAYATLVLPVALRRPAYWLWVVLAIVVYSGLVELIQPYVNRYGEWLDMAANTGGVVCGLILAWFINRFFPGDETLVRTAY